MMKAIINQNNRLKVKRRDRGLRNQERRRKEKEKRKGKKIRKKGSISQSIDRNGIPCRKK